MGIAGFLPVWTRRPVARMVEFVAPSNSDVQTRWIARPNLRNGEEVCLFVTFAPSNTIAEHNVFHARAWADAGFRVIILIISESFADEVPIDVLSFAAGVLLRENRGYDFGAWASALEQLPEVRNASLLALVNDSVFGPFDTFGRMLQRVRAMDADLIGSTESLQLVHHFQSFLLFFKPKALKSSAFWRFWSRVRAGGRFVAIYRYEAELLQMMERAGLRCTALFGGNCIKNPTLLRWRELIQEGFPYLKVAILRDNPFNVDLSDWPKVLRDSGYDPALAHQHLPQQTNRGLLARFRL